MLGVSESATLLAHTHTHTYGQNVNRVSQFSLSPTSVFTNSSLHADSGLE